MFSNQLNASWYTLSPDGPGISSRATYPSLEGFCGSRLTRLPGELFAY
jgi:hypothetical protein